MTMTRYKVIVGDPMGCNTTEWYEVEGYARMRAEQWSKTMPTTLQRVDFPVGLGTPEVETLAI